MGFCHLLGCAGGDVECDGPSLQTQRSGAGTAGKPAGRGKGRDIVRGTIFDGFLGFLPPSTLPSGAAEAGPKPYSPLTYIPRGSHVVCVAP